MRRNITIILIALTISGCDPGDGNGSFGEKNERCDIIFEIEVESGNSYKYNSETGVLNKLIDPFKDDKLYADTTLFLSNTDLCEILKLYHEFEIENYPKEFHVESGVILNPEPSYHIKFMTDNRTTEIIWIRNTIFFDSEKALRLREFLMQIDSIILSSPEFKNLPVEEYTWL